MKLASLKDGRDGRLIMVDQQLQNAAYVENVDSLREALENWQQLGPELQAFSDELNAGKLSSFSFDPRMLAAPLPRSAQWLDGSAYLSHVERVRKARGANMPDSFLSDPLMYQGASDTFLGPHDPIQVEDEAWGIDCEAEVAVVTDDVPMGVSLENAAKHICLVMLVNDVSLRNLIPAELAKGFGFLHGKPSSAFSPVAVSPDELQSAWNGVRLQHPLVTKLNNQRMGDPDAGVDLQFDFAQLIHHAARSRALSAATIIGSGTVSNQDTQRGTSCLVEKRVLEIIEHGEAKTPFLKYGDRVHIEMFDQQGNSIFGAIDQEVQSWPS